MLWLKVVHLGAGIAQWLEHWTRDRKVMGSNPCKSSGRIFLSGVNFLCWLLFRYLFHPCVTTVACKRPQSFCQKCRWHTHAPYICGFTWSDVVYGIHRMLWDGSSFMWHQPCQRCKYTTSVDIQKTCYKKLFTHVESHASAVSLLESG